ncbi:hypothetical protein ACFL2H_01955 [Planctomycetota bacterium]
MSDSIFEWVDVLELGLVATANRGAISTGLLSDRRLGVVSVLCPTFSGRMWFDGAFSDGITAAGSLDSANALAIIKSGPPTTDSR